MKHNWSIDNPVLELLFRNISQVALIIDSGTSILDCNNQAEDFFNIKAEELISLQLGDFINRISDVKIEDFVHDFSQSSQQSSTEEFLFFNNLGFSRNRITLIRIIDSENVYLCLISETIVDVNNLNPDFKAEDIDLIRDFSEELLSVSHEKSEQFIVDRIRQITNSLLVTFSWYDSERNQLILSSLSIGSKEGSIVERVVGGRLLGMSFELDEKQKKAILHERVANKLSKQTIHEASLGKIPKAMSHIIHTSLGIKWITGFGLLKNSELYGTIMIIGGKKSVFPEASFLAALSNIVLSALERNKSENLSKQYLERFKTLVNQAPYVVEIYDLEGVQIDVNQAYEDLWGFPASHTLGSFNILKSAEVEKTGLLSYVKRAYSGESVLVPDYFFDSSGETEGRGKGRKRWLRTSIYPLFDHANNITNIVVSHIDVTIHHEIQQKIEETNTNFKALLTNTGDLLFVLSPAYKFLDYFGPEESDLYFPPSFFIGKKIYELGFPDIVEVKLMKLVDDCMETKQKQFIDYYLDMPSGREWFHASANPIFSKDSNEVEKILCVVNNITYNRLQEEIIRKKEEDLYITLQSIGDGVIATDADGNIVRMNPVAEMMCGWTLSEAKGVPLHEVFVIVNAYSRETVPNPVEIVLKEGKTVGLANHTILISRNGREYQIADSAAPIKSDKNEISGVVLVFSDVTEKYNKDLVIREHQLQIQSMIDNVPGAIFSCDNDNDWSMIYMSDYISEITGYESNEFIDNQIRSYNSIIHVDDRSRVFNEAQYHINLKSKTYQLNYRILHKDGSIRWIEEHAKGVFDEDGKLLRIDGVITDITQRVRDQQLLIESEKKFREFAEALPDVAFEIDLHGNLLYANQNAYKKLGYSVEELNSNFNVFALISKVEQELLKENISLRLKGLKSSSSEYNLIRKDGSQFPAMFSTIPVYRDNAVVGFRGIFMDISYQKQNEKYVQLSTDILRILNSTVDFKESLKDVLRTLINHMHFEGIGLRLFDGKDYPYYTSQGFSEQFVEMENSLLKLDINKDICRDSEGNPLLECTCGMVISGNTELLKDNSTDYGSIYTNNSLPFLDVPKEADPRDNPRNNCIHYGYQSIALIPIKINNDVVGLLQLNHKSKNVFTIDLIHAYERICENIGMALMRKQSEDKVKESEEKYRTLISISNDAVFINKNNTITYINPAGVKLLGGKNEDDIVGKSPLDFFIPEYHGVIRERISKMLTENVPVSLVEEKIRQLDGNIIDVEVAASPFEINNEKAIQVIVHDITHRKKVEASLKQKIVNIEFLSESSLRLMDIEKTDELYDYIAKTVALFAPESYVLVNTYDEDLKTLTTRSLSGNSKLTQKILSIIGFNPIGKNFPVQESSSEILSDKLLKFEKSLHDITLGILPKSISGTLESLISISDIYSIGIISEKKLLANVLIITTKKTQFQGVEALEAFVKQAGIALKRRQAEDMLAESESKFSAVSEYSNNAICIMNLDGKIVWSNEALSQMIGYSKKQFLEAEDFRKFLAPESINFVWNNFLKKRENKKHENQYLFYYFRADGSKRLAENKMSDIVDKNGERLFLLNLADITEQHESDLKIRASEEKYRLLFTQMSEAVALHEAIFDDNNRMIDYRFIEINAGFEKLTGLLSKNILGKTVKEVLPDTEDIWFERYQEVALTGVPKSFEEYSAAFDKYYQVTAYRPSEGRFATIFSDITLRKKANLELQESEKKYRLIAENMGNIVVVLDMSLNATYVSPSIERVLGYSAEEYIKFSISDTISSEDLAIVLRVFEEEMALESQGGANPNRTRVFEMQELKKDGSKIWLEYVMSFIRDENGFPVGILSISRNISERKKDEIEIKRNESRLRSLVKISQYQASTVQEMLDVALHEAVILTESEFGYIFFYDEDAQEFELNSWSRDVMEECKVPNQQYSYKLKDTGLWGEVVRQRGNIIVNDYQSDSVYKKGTPHGHVPIQKFMSVPVYSFNKIVAVVGVANKFDDYNNTDAEQLSLLMETVWRYVDLRNAQQKIADSEKNYKIIFNSTSEAFFIHDITDGRIMDVNTPMIKMFGYDSFEEVIGKTMEYFSAGIDGYDNNKVLNLLQETIDRGSMSFEWYAKRKNGELFWLEVSLQHTKLNNKEVVLAVTRDVTSRKNAELELLEAKERAEENDRLKSAFLANISHEIRTPMNGILGFAELLKTPGLDTEEVGQYVDVIQQSGQRMLGIINDIVDISKIEAGQVLINKGDTDINSIIKELYAFFLPETQKKKLVLKYQDLPQDVISHVETDQVKLTQVLSNLIKNAIKFTQHGEIEFGCYLIDDVLHFFIKDTGDGISNENIDLIFDRFRQADVSLTRQYEGAGLGLSISKAYVELLGGKIWVESEYGKGSCFSFTLPYLVSKSKPVSNAFIDNVGQKLSEDIVILIVEDDLTSMVLLKRILSSYSQSIYQAYNGFEALEKVQKHTDIEIVLMDLKMPIMDGYEAIVKMKQIRPDLPVIAQTANAFSEDRVQAIEAGFDDYISKPIRKEVLIEKINAILKQ